MNIDKLILKFIRKHKKKTPQKTKTKKKNRIASEEQSWRTDTTPFQALLQSYNNQECGIGERIDKLMEQNREFRNRHT